MTNDEARMTNDGITEATAPYFPDEFPRTGENGASTAVGLTEKGSFWRTSQMWLRQPTVEKVNRYLSHVSNQPLSYPHVGATNFDGRLTGYVHDCHRSCLGNGSELFDRAQAALESWRMFDLPWILLAWPETPIEPGAIVAPVIYFGGVWWPNACRIVYVVNEQFPHQRFGFAYGTLLDHMERGEERFLVEMLPDGSVWFEIRAFSQPASFLSCCASSLARRGQLRFFKDAHAAMLQAVSKQ